LSFRIIPRLDVKGPNLVKGVHMEGLRVLGLPEAYALRYYQDSADEIIYIDTVASLYGRNNLSEIVSRAAEQIYIPLTVGGGIRGVEDISRLLRAGADKVAINTGAIANPQLINDGARSFGSQCIVLYVEAKQRGSGDYECLTDNARERSGVDVFEWVRRAVDLGAGEILLTSVDREGTGKGFDIELTARVSEMVDVPVIASGGAGTREHVADVISQGKADAICAASLFHYALVEEMAETAAGVSEGNVEFLKRGLPIPSLGRRDLTPTTICDLKKFLGGRGVTVRHTRSHSEPHVVAARTVELNEH
jgi:cyclase